MHGNQFTNVLTLAAALSMAGWVARPDGNHDHLVNFNNQNYNYQNRYHPYQQPQSDQWRSNGFQQQQQQQQFQNGPLLAQAVAPQYNLNPNTQSNIYQSKDAEDTFRAYLELQELISWQESYRRGDLMPQNTNPQFVLPVSNPSERIDNILSNCNDDGYATGSSVGSPASTHLGSEVDNLSIHSNSPSPQEVFDLDQNLNQQSEPFQHINSPLADGVFDIDEILNDEQGAMSPVMPYNDETPKGPFASLLSSLDQDLQYADSPALKNPSFDSFLTKPSPEYKPPSYTFSQKYEDPFSMKFTNGSLPDGFSQDTLVDIGNFDPSIFDDNTESQDDILDKALVQSLHQKENPATVAIKQEEDDDYWLRPQSPMVEHDYFNRDEMKPLQTANPITKHQPQMNNLQRPITFAPSRRQQPSPMTPTNTRVRGRTFAPSHSATASSLTLAKPSSIKPKVKQQKQKSSILWNDFLYTSTDLVEMPVEKFNEVIKQLDEVRQHIAKDERRKGKNKLAARNCRKRKMDVIESLDNGVNILEQQRQELLQERKRILDETRQIKLKTEWLNDYIFKHIKDSNGLPYNEKDYSLKYTADGNVYVVPVGAGNNNGN